MLHDVIIVGGGPAGLSAAQWLGRARRSVLVVDSGKPRNASSHAMHGFLTRDGIDPAVFLRIARGELDAYPGVAFVAAEVVTAARDEGCGFVVQLADGSEPRSRKLLLATGVVDELPTLPDIRMFYGTSVHHCPYCDGYEHRDRPMMVVGPAAKAAGLAMMLRRWTEDVAFRPDDPDALSPAEVARLHEAGVTVLREPIVALEGEFGKLRSVSFADGTRRACAAIFFNTGQHQRSPLLAQLGVPLSQRGGALTNAQEETRVRGLFVAGDATRDVQFAVVAAAEGATAAVAIDHELLHEDGVL